MHGIGALWEKRRGVLVEIVDILVGVGPDDGFWCLSGHGGEEISRNLMLFIAIHSSTMHFKNAPQQRSNVGQRWEYCFG